ncbi:MAG: twin-arginine translocase subunit TatC, partial [bacterium]|nr:twin-arginine translocase subunit TatC [bacterium]
MDHLDELRRRLFRAIGAFLLAFLICWSFAGRIYEFLAQPIYRILPEDTKLVFLGITDPFLVYVKVAALAGIFLASPVVLYQLWAFVAPGLYRRERRMATPFIFFGTLLFLAGGAFAYYVAFPFAVDFLLGLGEQFQPTLTINRYLSFLMTVVLGLGVMFELPTLIFLLSRLGLVTPGFLLRHFRWAVLVIFIVAAIITPTPDVINLCIFAVPTILLYLLGVGVAALYGPRRETEDEVVPLQITHYLTFCVVVGVSLGMMIGAREILLHDYFGLGFRHTTLAVLRFEALRSAAVAAVTAMVGLTLRMLFERLLSAGPERVRRFRPRLDSFSGGSLNALLTAVGALLVGTGLHLVLEISTVDLFRLIGPVAACLILLGVHLGFTRANEEGSAHPYPASMAPVIVVLPVLLIGVLAWNNPLPSELTRQTWIANSPLVLGGGLLYVLVYLMIRRPRTASAPEAKATPQVRLRSPLPLILSALVLGILGALTLILDRPGLEVRQPHNVILIGIDSLRLDHTSPELSPNLRRLAETGIAMRDAISQAPWTMPAVASTLTGRYPQEHGAFSFRTYLGSREVTLAEILREAGYATGAISSSIFLDAPHGFSQGFEYFHDDHSTGASQDVTDRAIDFLNRHQEERFFLFAYYSDPHYEYRDHEEFDFADSYAGRLTDPAMDIHAIRSEGEHLDPVEVEYLRDLYDEEIALTDREIGRLLDELQSLELAEPTAVVVVGSHGEEFLERGWVGHTINLYDEVIRVPLVFRLPGIEPRQREVEGIVETRAVFPTLLDYLGMEWERHPSENSLLAQLRGTEEGARPEAGAFSSVWLAEENVRRSAYRTDSWKLVVDHLANR